MLLWQDPTLDKHRRIKHAKETFENRNYPYVVRQSQEAVELLLKASLRLVDVEPPKWYDVGTALRREAHRFSLMVSAAHT
jgi:HEPN domain-containing protein